MHGARRYFCVEQANALIPAMSEVFAYTRTVRERLERLVARLEDLGHPPDPNRLEVDTSAPERIQNMQRELLGMVAELDRHIDRITEMGPKVRRADGLVDFYSRLRGRVVYLCWKWGEDEVTHYHEPGEGFARRKPIRRPQDFEGDLLN